MAEKNHVINPLIEIDEANFTFSKASFELLRGNHSTSTELFKKSNSLYIKLIQEIFQYLGERDREKLYASVLNVFGAYRYFIIQQYKTNPELLGELYNQQLVTKSILLNTSNKIKNRILKSGDRVLIDLYDEVQTLKQEIGNYSNLSEEELNSAGINLDSLKYKMNLKDDQLSEYASFYEEESRMVTWKDIQASLEKGEAAIEIVRIKDYDFRKGESGDQVLYAALIVTSKTKDHPEIVLLENGLDLEKKHIRYYRNSVILKSVDKQSYEKFWQPISDKLKGINKIYLSPDGVYNTVNPVTL